MSMDLKLRMRTDPDFKDLLQRLVRSGTIRYSETPITLKSGIKSRVYAGVREDVTDDPLLGKLIGRELIRHAHMFYEGVGDRHLCAIGIPTAGTGLAAAASFASGCSYRIMREVKKKHGAHTTWVNGVPDTARHTYFSVDNVITHGISLLEKIEQLEEDGYPTKEMLHLVFIDRGQSGLQRVRSAGYRGEAVFDLLDLVSAFGELGLWEPEQVQAVEDEMRILRAPA